MSQIVSITLALKRKHALFPALRCAPSLPTTKFNKFSRKPWQKVLSITKLYGRKDKYVWYFHVTKKKSYQAFPIQPAPISVDCLSEVLPDQHGQQKIYFTWIVFLSPRHAVKMDPNRKIKRQGKTFSEQWNKILMIQKYWWFKYHRKLREASGQKMVKVGALSQQGGGGVQSLSGQCPNRGLVK